MGRLIIHIGTHKTATTSIQRGLSRNRQVLLERGVLYPDYDLIGAKGHYAHIGIANAFSKAHPDMSREQAIRFFAEVSRRARDYDVTILSAEAFFRHIDLTKDGNPRKIPGQPEPYWKARQAYINDLRHHFDHDNIEIVMAVRRQIDYGMSLYQEHVKTSRYNADFATFRAKHWQRFDYLRQARAWREGFGILRLLRFEDFVQSEDVLKSFGTLIDVDLSGLTAAPRENASLPPDLVVLKRMMADSSASTNGLRDMVDKISRGSLKAILKDMPKRSLYQDLEDMQAFHRSFSDANELLKREFLPLLSSHEPLFSDTLASDYLFGDTLHPEFLLQLSRHLAKT